MMPGIPKEVKNAQIDDREIDRVEAIIRSMTPAERVDPDLIDQSRRVRIARGSGSDPARVGELVKQFKEMSKMMKRMGGMGSKRISKSRRKAAKGKGKGPGGRTTGGGRTAPNTKAPLRLPNLDPTPARRSKIGAWVKSLASALFDWYVALKDYGDHEPFPQTARGDFLYNGWWRPLTKLNPIPAAPSRGSPPRRRATSRP